MGWMITVNNCYIFSDCGWDKPGESLGKWGMADFYEFCFAYFTVAVEPEHRMYLDLFLYVYEKDKDTVDDF